jgi:general secretion pathway protein E/type IV pilus assembly protein PilB
MTELLIEPARSTGCPDLEGLSEVVKAAAAGQRSPIDDILDADIVDEEPYMRALCEALGLEWLDSIPPPDVIATYDPFNFAARQAAVQAVDLPIVWRMASRRRVHEALRRLYGVGADTFEKILEGRVGDYENLESTDEASVIDDVEDEEASVVKFVNQIIREALEQRATDIHVEPLSDNLRIRYRVDGKLGFRRTSRRCRAR